MATQTQTKKWVKASAVVAVTGWDGQRLRWARETGLIDYRKVVGRIKEYDFNSIPSQFIKQTA